MKIGLVCPYDWDVPGGVQFHIRDVAEQLINWGHEVSVLSPASEETDLPEWLVPAGRAVPVPFNGSVARLSFGPIAATRVRRWIAEGDFDVVHIHEPPTPSLSILTCWLAEGPLVGTFHMAVERSRTMNAVSPILESALEKLSLRIAVSPAARETALLHHGREVVILPNGVHTSFFAHAKPNVKWQGKTLAFIGRFEESRKGLDVLLKAMPNVIASHPDVRLLVAGPGDSDNVDLDPTIASRITFLGRVSEEEKAQLLKSVDIYVAPNTGGESFGIILAEAMSAGTPVIATDLEAFVDVLAGAGIHFPNGDSDRLAEKISYLFDHPEQREEMSRKGLEVAQRYDWTKIVAELITIYETVSMGRTKVTTERRRRRE